MATTFITLVVTSFFLTNFTSGIVFVISIGVKSSDIAIPLAPLYIVIKSCASDFIWYWAKPWPSIHNLAALKAWSLESLPVSNNWLSRILISLLSDILVTLINKLVYKTSSSLYLSGGKSPDSMVDPPIDVPIFTNILIYL